MYIEVIRKHDTLNMIVVLQSRPSAFTLFMQDKICMFILKELKAVGYEGVACKAIPKELKAANRV